MKKLGKITPRRKIHNLGVIMNLKDFCKLKGTTLNKVADNLNIAASTLYAISSGDTALDKVGVSLFMRLADALECTTDELYNVLKDNESASDESKSLSPDELELVAIYRNLTPTGQQQLLLFARGCMSTFPKNNQLRANQETA